MSSDEVARNIVDAIENRSRTITLTGQGKLTVALSKFIPAFLDKMVYKHFTKERDPLLH
jgi:short-subunit dehydrogenase